MREAAMAMVPSFDVPDEALQALGITPDQFARELRLAAAVFWYHRAVVSQEIAAQIAGLDRTDFLLTLAKRQLDTVVVDLDDLDRELARARTAGH